MSLHTWEYIGRIVSLLGNITVANGYNTNAGLVVTREPAQIELQDPERIVVLLDAMRAPEDPAMRKIGLQLVIAVVGQVKTGIDDTQLRMHKVAADIHRAMSDTALRVAHFAPGNEWPVPQFIESSVVPPSEGMKWVGAAARYSATLRLRTTPTTHIT